MDVARSLGEGAERGGGREGRGGVSLSLSLCLSLCLSLSRDKSMLISMKLCFSATQSYSCILQQLFIEKRYGFNDVK